jgi:hypothetical protein
VVGSRVTGDLDNICDSRVAIASGITREGEHKAAIIAREADGDLTASAASSSVNRHSAQLIVGSASTFFCRYAACRDATAIRSASCGNSLRQIHLAQEALVP